MHITQARHYVAVAIAALIVAAGPGTAWSEESLASADVVKAFVAAYNEHNIEAMMARCSDSVRWLTVLDDAVAVEADGKAALKSAMTSHFENSPNTYSKLLVIESDGPMVVAIEQAMPNADEPDRSQCAASVYQLVEGLIENVWYFDAYRCGG